MKDNVSRIFNDIDAARNIDEVNGALAAVRTLDKETQADFVSCLRTKFSASAQRADKKGFAVVDIEPLDAADLDQGFRILFHSPKP